MLGSKIISPANVGAASQSAVIRIAAMPNRFMFPLLLSWNENGTQFPLTVPPLCEVRYPHEPQIISQNLGGSGIGLGWRSGISLKTPARFRRRSEAAQQTRS